MKTKHFFLVALAMIFALPAVLGLISCESEVTTSAGYTYDVKYKSALSYPSIQKDYLYEYDDILYDLQKAVGSKDNIIKAHQSRVDDQMKAACQKVLDAWKDNVHSPFLTYSLICKIIDNGSVEETIATYEIGPASDPAKPYIRYSLEADEQGAWEKYSSLNLSGKVKEGTSKALTAIVGLHSVKKIGNVTISNLSDSKFEKQFGYVFKTIWQKSENLDNYVSDICDSIADVIVRDIYEQYPQQIAVASNISVIREGFRTNEKKKIWSKEFPATYVPED